MILVAGHFGTLYSYATVAGRVAEALRAHDMLAGCQNLDMAWHPRWEHLRGSQPGAHVADGISSTVVTHVLLVAAPNHYVSGYADMLGRERAAIFVSPNTDRLADEHAETISKFGMAIAPSRFCAETVGRQCSIDAMTVLPLGSPVPAGCRNTRDMATLNVMHFTSDQAWPSRKGTEVLLKAWASLQPLQAEARLTIHGPPALRKDALYKIADLGIDETVTYEPSASHGTSDEDLIKLYEQADLIVAPSRSEGFGMMILGALVAGVPLLTTCNTGHAEFLKLRPGAWLPIPTPTSGPIAFEDGNAPIVDVETLTEMLDLSTTDFLRGRMILSEARFGAAKEPGWGSWDTALAQWVRRLKDWMEETA